MAWTDKLNENSLNWLLEPDFLNPSIRYHALRDLLDRPDDDPDVIAARTAIMASGPVPVILNAQSSEGYWEKPGGGYGKYRGTVWQIMFLGDFAADPAEARVQRGCTYLLDHSIADGSGFAAANLIPAPSGVLHCLNGNLVTALIHLGYLDHPLVQQAIDWQARAITGEPPINYFASGTSGPEFACGHNDQQSCGWGATKAMKAFAAVPPSRRSPIVQRAIERGSAFLLAHDLTKADYPSGGTVSAHWFKLGFPLSYWSDVLETLSALVTLGYGGDPRLSPAYQWLLSKQDAHGRWTLEASLNRRMWVNIEKDNKPNKWITLRALRVIKAVEELMRA